jgi:redox-regulated HSP33 family molecular chaperone
MAMPGADDEQLAQLEENNYPNGEKLSAALEKTPQFRGLMEPIMKGIELSFGRPQDLFFKCNCSY